MGKAPYRGGRLSLPLGTSAPSYKIAKELHFLPLIQQSLLAHAAPEVMAYNFMEFGQLQGGNCITLSRICSPFYDKAVFFYVFEYIQQPWQRCKQVELHYWGRTRKFRENAMWEQAAYRFWSYHGQAGDFTSRSFPWRREIRSEN